MIYSGAGDCKRCSGSGYKPEQIEAPQIPQQERPVAAQGYEVVIEERVESTGRVRRRERKRSAPRSKTIPIKSLTRATLAAFALDAGEMPDIARPKTRGDCIDGPRPCPWVGCKYHLFLDVLDTGNLKLNFIDIEPEQMIESCALDIADRGGLTLEDTGRLANLTRERVRQVEVKAAVELKAKLEADGIDASALDDFPHPESFDNPDAAPTAANREESAKRARAAYKERQRAAAIATKKSEDDAA